MKNLVAFLAMCLSASVCQAVSVTVAESTYSYANGGLVTGTLLVSWPAFATGATSVAAGNTTVAITAGVLSVSLVANDVADPPVFYTATFRTSRGSYTQQWVVPSVAGPLQISGVTRVSNSPITIQPSQISKVGALAGDLIYYDGSNYNRLRIGANPTGRILSIDTSLAGKLKWIANSGGSGGGVWGAITGTLTDQTDLVTALGLKQNSLGFTPANVASNLSDLANAATARTNLGLGTAAMSASSAFEPAITAGTSAQVWLGNKTFATLNSAIVPELTNLYFTDARAVTAMAGLYEVPLTFSSPLIRTVNALTIQVANTSQAGYLSSADWNTFNGKQASLGYTPLNPANNLSELTAATARTNLGLGTAAVTAASAYATAVHTHAAADTTSGQFAMARLASGTPTGSKFVRDDGVLAVPASGTGDVVGPSSATDNCVARFDTTTGKLVQNSSLCVDDSGNTTTPGTFTSGSGVTTGGQQTLGNSTGDTVASFLKINSGDGASNAEPGYLWMRSSHTTKRNAYLYPCTDADGFLCLGSSAPTADSSDVVLTANNTATVTNKSIAASQLTGLVSLAQGGTNCATPFAINPQTTTYQALAADFTCFKTIEVASGTFTITLVASGSQPVAGTWINIANYGTGIVTVARSGQNINGATNNFSVGLNSNLRIRSDGTNYFAESGFLNPLSSVGDILYLNSAGFTSRLMVGDQTTVILGGTTVPTYGQVDSSRMVAANKTHTVSFNLFDPVIGDSYRVLFEEARAITITRVACNVIGGTNAVINLFKTTEATSGSGGTQALTADLTCTAGALVASTTFSSAGVAARIPVALKLTSLSGTNTDLHVFIEYTVN